jgi:hypothetical protein
MAHWATCIGGCLTPDAGAVGDLIVGQDIGG